MNTQCANDTSVSHHAVPNEPFHKLLTAASKVIQSGGTSELNKNIYAL